ncbi:winged helix-turn-helix transcriptional regulator [Pseudactinotalea suaedae]|uniref:winged helix-turn-helix transcriptional regulator n=1 Tax=Pseudactinotalea suaedae TaxID=1524924 RepID=UPI001F4F6C6B|nr:helix-turn-helix domain-containing protein [Pseudactinotalea suaedae]
MPTPHERELRECPVDAALSVIGGRWKATILWRLTEGPMRTSELRRSIPQVTERMLIRHLQELVRDGVLIRTDARTVPPHVTYEISEYGSTLAAVVAALCEWGRNHQRRQAGTSTSDVLQTRHEH